MSEAATALDAKDFDIELRLLVDAIFLSATTTTSAAMPGRRSSAGSPPR